MPRLCSKYNNVDKRSGQTAVSASKKHKKISSNTRALCDLCLTVSKK